MFGRNKPLTCAVCNQRLYRSWGIDDDGNETEQKSHMYFGDDLDKQKRDSLLDYHHTPMTRQELREAQSRVRKFSPNHPSLSEKAPSEGNSDSELPDNVISLQQFRDRKRTQ